MRECELNTSDFVFYFSTSAVFWWYGSGCRGGGLASGSALVSINVVTLRRAWLILGWVTVSG